MTRTDALSLGATKAASIVALVRATAADDTAADLLRRGARVRGKVVDVKKASSRAIARATVEVRTGATPRGRMVTREEPAACAVLEKAATLGRREGREGDREGRARHRRRQSHDWDVRSPTSRCSARRRARRRAERRTRRQLSAGPRTAQRWTAEELGSSSAARRTVYVALRLNTVDVLM